MSEGIIALLTLAGSALVSALVGLIVKRVEARVDKHQQQDDALKSEHAKRQEEIKFEQFHQMLLGELKEALAPLEEKISKLTRNFSEERAASITTLRSKMKSLRDQYINQGFADIGDKATWKELYDHYRDLGGNHFKEYVDMWKSDVEKLPLDCNNSDTKNKK